MKDLAFIAIGLLTAGALAWVWVVTPDRVVTPIGWGLLGAIAGGVIGTIIGGYQYSLIDGSRVQIGTTEMIAAGCGWLVGSGIGLLAARRLPPATQAQAWVLRAMAVTAIPIGILATRFQATRVVPCGYGQEMLPALQRATLVNAALVTLMLLLVAGAARHRPPAGPEALNPLARAGIALGVFAMIVILINVRDMPPGSERGHAYGARGYCRAIGR